ncbi:sigma-70 family RNA polymerase sigma factor [Larkinella knui]|uniref:Sigma-70 family RNA polymerase sigma factor n=1 Tax=Larkinella knui TaxID=2025310 RepID=A0A3P1CKY6_9BACT|nr:sigma-70 family RNA polymerase sigma factor [Larkinella knui]RRB13860.1 sigma-70 family RNA polymerase sigma factor [Larkinella knui]
MPNDTEVAELWLAFKKGDKGAFGSLATVFYKTLYNYGTKLTTDYTLVEDCIQDLFLEMWKRREFLGETEHVRFYLLKALRRKLFLEKKTSDKRLHQFIENTDDIDFIGEFSIESRIIELETTEQHLKKLNQVLTQLSKREREVIYLKFYQELDYEQIASLMAINYQSARNLIYNALKGLKSAWQHDG